MKGLILSVPRHFLKVGCDVEDHAEDNVEEEMAEKDCVWGVGEDAGGNYRRNFSIYRTHHDFFVKG
jgi:hypothetical protein